MINKESYTSKTGEVFRKLIRDEVTESPLDCLASVSITADDGHRAWSVVKDLSDCDVNYICEQLEDEIESRRKDGRYFWSDLCSVPVETESRLEKT